MSAPVDAGRATTGVTTAASTWTVNLPATIAVGDLLVARMRVASQEAITGGDFNTVWSLIFGIDFTDASDDSEMVFAKIADGSEGTTDTIIYGSTCKGAAIVWRVTGADSNIANINIGLETFTTANFDPVDRSFPFTGDWLRLLGIGLDGETQTFTAPTNYSNTVTNNSGTGGAVASNCRIAGASRGLTAVSSENAGAWTHAAPNSGGSHLTISVPAPIAHASLLLPNRNQLAIRR